MKVVCVAVATFLAVAVVTAGPPAQVPPPSVVERALSAVPAERLAEVSPTVREAVAHGEIPLQALLGSLGIAPPPPAGAPTDAQSKQYVSHWVSHYTCLSAGIDEDAVGEAAIGTGCSGEAMGDAAGAPTGYPSYYTSSDGSIYTGYWQVPSNSETCTTDNTDLTRYFTTWLYAPNARSAHVRLGAADYFKLWINHSLVLSRTTGGAKPWTADEYVGTVTLNQGWNLIVLKQTFLQLGPYSSTDQTNNYKYFSLRFASDAAGTAMTDLVAAFDPNCDDSSTSRGIYTRVFVPSMAHNTGVLGSVWRTDLTLTNNTHTPWTYFLRFYREGNNSGIPERKVTTTLQSFETRTWTDALTTLFGLTEDQKGYAVVLGGYYYYQTTPPSGYGGVQAKVYNQATAGTFGMEVPVVYLYNGIWYEAAFYGVRNGRFRTNLALMPAINAGGTADVQVTIIDPGLAAPVSKEYAGITGLWQLNNVFADLGVASLTTDKATLYVRFLSNPAGTYWLGNVTVTDGNPAAGVNGTSDPSYISPMYMPEYPPWRN